MQLRVKSNGRIVELSTELYNGLSADQKRSYDVISKEDKPEEKKVENTVVVTKNGQTPPTGNGKKGDKKNK